MDPDMQILLKEIQKLAAAQATTQQLLAEQKDLLERCFIDVDAFVGKRFMDTDVTVECRIDDTELCQDTTATIEQAKSEFISGRQETDGEELMSGRAIFADEMRYNAATEQPDVEASVGLSTQMLLTMGQILSVTSDDDLTYCVRLPTSTPTPTVQLPKDELLVSNPFLVRGRHTRLRTCARPPRPSNPADYVPTKCSMYCCTSFTSKLVTACSSSPTRLSTKVINRFNKQPCPPPFQAQVFSEQGMHKVMVGYLLDAESDVIQSKPPWPPPHMQIKFEYDSDDIYSFSWPSLPTVAPALASWKCYSLPRNPPWPLQACHYFRIMHAKTVESGKHLTVATNWSSRVFIQEERQQKCGGTVGIAWHEDSLIVPKWLSDKVMAFLILHGEAIPVFLGCVLTTILILLEFLKLKENWQCAICLAPTRLGVTSAGELLQEQNQNHKGCSSNTNVIMSTQQDSVQICAPFPLSNFCSMCSVVNWQQPGPFFCSYAVLVHLNTSELVVLHWVSSGCIQIVEGCLDWSFIIRTTTSTTSDAALLFVTDDSSDHCTLLRQLDSAKTQRNLHMHAPVHLIVDHIIVSLLTSSILLGTLLASQSVTKDVQYNNISLSWISSLSHESFGSSIFISLTAQGNTRDSMLVFGLAKSIIMWDPGAKPMSFLHSNSFDASKTCYIQALQTVWQLWNANCVRCNIRCTNLSSLMQHQQGFWLSACRVQVYPLQSLLVETYGNMCDIGAADDITYDAISLDATQHWSAKPLLLDESKNFAVIYIDMKTRLEFNLTSTFMCAPLVFDMLPTSFQTCYVLVVYHQLNPWLTSAYRANSCFRHAAAEMTHRIGTYQLFEQAVGVQFRLMLEYVLLETRLSRGSFLRSSVIANIKLHDLPEQVSIHLLWDPVGANTLHRLGGKPILKEGGMSVHAYGGTARWGQYMSSCPTHTRTYNMIVTASSKAKARPYLVSWCLSNAAFALPSGPERTATVGGGYVASEFTGDFNGLRSDVQVFKIWLLRPTRADYSAENVFSQLSIGLFGLTKDDVPEQEFQQFPWDPGGSVLLHRLGGKPILKEGGMSGDQLRLGRHKGLWALHQPRHAWMGVQMPKTKTGTGIKQLQQTDQVANSLP